MPPWDRNERAGLGPALTLFTPAEKNGCQALLSQ
jgi:hypothetical protein